MGWISSVLIFLFFHQAAFATPDTEDYRMGDEWGKKRVTRAQLAVETPVFRRTVLSTAYFGGATAFYLGRFNGHALMATNHHVIDDGECNSRAAFFPWLQLRLDCQRVLGTWPSIDLALFEVDVDPADEKTMESIQGNFAFREEIRQRAPLLTVGFGGAGNPLRFMEANQDDDCIVFSKDGEYRLMEDPDTVNPGNYKAWSFANGCDASHGDSGSPMVERQTGSVLGILWTGRVPTSSLVRTTKYLQNLLAINGPEIWSELSYSVPSPQIGKYFESLIAGGHIPRDLSDTLQAMLTQ